MCQQFFHHSSKWVLTYQQDKNGQKNWDYFYHNTWLYKLHQPYVWVERIMQRQKMSKGFVFFCFTPAFSHHSLVYGISSSAAFLRAISFCNTPIFVPIQLFSSIRDLIPTACKTPKNQIHNYQKTPKKKTPRRTIITQKPNTSSKNSKKENQVQICFLQSINQIK